MEALVTEKIIRPAFKDLLQRSGEQKDGLTVLSFNHIPKGIIDKEYFKNEFFPLESENDFKKLNNILQGAKKNLDKGRYYFEERPNKFPKKVEEHTANATDNGTFKFIASNEQVDRSGEIIKQEGWDLKY